MWGGLNSVTDSYWLILTPFVHGFEWSPGFPPTCSLSRGMLGTCIVWHTSRTWRRRVSQLKWVWARFDQDLSGHHNVGCFQTLISLIQCHLTKLGDLNACGIFGSWWHCFCDINISLWCISPCKMSLGVSPIVFFFSLFFRWSLPIGSWRDDPHFSQAMEVAALGWSSPLEAVEFLRSLHRITSQAAVGSPPRI